MRRTCVMRFTQQGSFSSAVRRSCGGPAPLNGAAQAGQRSEVAGWRKSHESSITLPRVLKKRIALLSVPLRISSELDKLLDGLHPDVAAAYALTRLVQRLIELQPLLLDMIVTHGLVDLGELVASLPLNALVERRKLAKRTRET